MIKYTVLVIFLIVACLSFDVDASKKTDCEIVTYDKIYHQGSQMNTDLQIIKKSDCSRQIQDIFKDFVVEFNGLLHKNYFNSILEERGLKQNIKLIPEKVKVVLLSSYLKKKFSLRPGLEMKEISVLNSSKSFLLDNSDKLYLSCDDCKKVGNKNIKATIVRLNGQKKTEWINSTLKVRTKVLVSRRDLQFGSDKLSKNYFKEDYIYSIRPEIYFSNIKTVQFFKLNKSLPAGVVLKSSDLVPQVLVKYGYPISIILKSKTLKLTGKAVPTSTGRFNEIIKLKTIPRKKIITGKVVDFNKVVIEL